MTTRRRQVSKSFIFVVNNYDESHEDLIQSAPEYKYLLYGREVAPQTGTPHLQGYVIWKRAFRITQLARLFPGFHWEIAYAGEQANYDYCTKDCGIDFFEHDRRKKRGTRTDWKSIYEAIDDGATARDILVQDPHVFISHTKGVERAIALMQKPRMVQTYCFWIFGPTGSGKSTHVKERVPNAGWLTLDKSGFFSNYHNEEVVVLDDPNLDYISRELFLALVNHTPYNLNIKGGDMVFNSRVIVVIHNSDPRMSFHAGDRSVQRRVHTIAQFQADHSFALVKQDDAFDLGGMA